MSVIEVIINKGTIGFKEQDFQTRWEFWKAIEKAVTRPALKGLFNHYFQSGEKDAGVSRELVKEVVSRLHLHYEDILDENCNPLEDYQASDALHYLVKHFITGMVTLKDPETLFDTCVEGVTALISKDKA